MHGRQLPSFMLSGGWRVRLGVRVAGVLLGTTLIGGTLGTGVAYADTAPPSPPTSATAVAGDQTAVVSWQPGAGTAGVTAWTVTAQPGGQSITVGPDELTATLTGLADGTSYQFSVVGTNESGPGVAATTAPVVPRQPSTLTVISKVAARVVYGTKTTVVGQLRGRDGGTVPNEPVELVAQRLGDTSWTPLARSSTDSLGKARFAVALSRSSVVRLRHVADAVDASSIAAGTISVAFKVTAGASTLRPAVGSIVTIRGALQPARGGAPMILQAYGRNTWTSITSVKTTSNGGYVLRWRARTGTKTLLRVVTPAVPGLVYGSSTRLDVLPHDTVASLARQILANRRITLATVHVSGVRDLGDPMRQMQDLAAGRLVHRSSYGGAPGGYVAVDIRVLRTMLALSRVATFTVSEIAGGSHTGGSVHYQGRAVDFDVVNGVSVHRGSGYGVVVTTCRSLGAVTVFSPSYDPYGGHGNHVHCDWGKA